MAISNQFTNYLFDDIQFTNRLCILAIDKLTVLIDKEKVYILCTKKLRKFKERYFVTSVC